MILVERETGKLLNTGLTRAISEEEDQYYVFDNFAEAKEWIIQKIRTTGFDIEGIIIDHLGEVVESFPHR